MVGFYNETIGPLHSLGELGTSFARFEYVVIPWDTVSGDWPLKPTDFMISIHIGSYMFVVFEL